MSDLVSLLIDLSTIQGGASTDGKVDDISKAARSSMVRALGVMSVSDFISAVLSMLESGEPRVSCITVNLHIETYTPARSKRVHSIYSANVCLMYQTKHAKKLSLLSIRL